MARARVVEAGDMLNNRADRRSWPLRTLQPDSEES